MGSSSSNILTQTNDSDLEENKKEENNENEIINQHNSKKDQKRGSLYKFCFSSQLLSQSNLLLYTNYLNINSDFTSVIENLKEKTEKLSFKSSNHSIAAGYRKGYKSEFVNQDKFFVLLSGPIEAYCVIDGHDTFGNKVAQIC